MCRSHYTVHITGAALATTIASLPLGHHEAQRQQQGALVHGDGVGYPSTLVVAGRRSRQNQALRNAKGWQPVRAFGSRLGCPVRNGDEAARPDDPRTRRRGRRGRRCEHSASRRASPRPAPVPDVPRPHGAEVVPRHRLRGLLDPSLGGIPHKLPRPRPGKQQREHERAVRVLRRRESVVGGDGVERAHVDAAPGGAVRRVRLCFPVSPPLLPARRPHEHVLTWSKPEGSFASK